MKFKDKIKDILERVDDNNENGLKMILSVIEEIVAIQEDQKAGV